MRIWISETEFPRVGLSFADAQAVCAELSRQTGQTLRLPTLLEWRQAARAGIQNLPYPWGYDRDLPEHLRFGLPEPPSTPGPAFGYGFRDLAGGVWEWTAEGVLVGSAWSESNPETLKIDHAWVPPEGYGDLDTGIRLVWVE
jgi:formylglycine-generating enzyme required for sulfatase activity